MFSKKKINILCAAIIYKKNKKIDVRLVSLNKAIGKSCFFFLQTYIQD